MENMHVVKETNLAVEENPFVLFLRYLGSIFLQTRTKLNKSLKNILNCCKLQVVFKNKTRFRQQLLFQGSDSQISYF